MVLHLVTPVFLYVLLQIIIVSHYGQHPMMRRFAYVVFPMQFFGAWALFYATLLRDMGFGSRVGAILGALAIVGVITQYLVHPDPLVASNAAVSSIFALQLIPAVIAWSVMMVRWRRLKRRYVELPTAPEGLEP